MAHFARLDLNNVVINVIKLNDSDCLDEHGLESEQVGINCLRNIFGSDTIWVQTSYNNRIRKNFACIGYSYYPDIDAFVSQQPYPSWTLDIESGDWNPPIPSPEFDENIKYYWNEEHQLWQTWPTSENI